MPRSLFLTKIQIYISYAMIPAPYFLFIGKTSFQRYLFAYFSSKHNVNNRYIFRTAKVFISFLSFDGH